MVESTTQTDSSSTAAEDADAQKAFDKGVQTIFKMFAQELVKASSKDDQNREIDKRNNEAIDQAMGPDGDGVWPELEPRK